MHPIVPIIMAFGAVTFITGSIVFAVFGIKQINIVKILGKEYSLWRFVLATVGSGMLLIMLSIYIHKNVPYEPEPDPQQFQPMLSSSLKYELESILSNIKSDALVSDINRFQQEYQVALKEEDEKTIGLLSLEMEYKLRTILEDQGYAPTQAEQEVKRIMGFLKQKPQQ